MTTQNLTPAVPDDFAKCVKCIYRFTCIVPPSKCDGPNARPAVSIPLSTWNEGR